jgi:mRNA interferase RelE/StbE
MAERPYTVEFAPAAARQIRKLAAGDRDRVLKGTRKLAGTARSTAGGRGGKSVKTLHGRSDRFFRLRVGDHRVMYDVLDDDRVILVLGVVHRRDLERWLRGR